MSRPNICLCDLRRNTQILSQDSRCAGPVSTGAERITGLNRSYGLQDVEVPRISRQSVIEGV